MEMRSTIPLKSLSLPMGSTTGTALVRSLSCIILTTLSKFAPLMSILLTKAMRGTL